MLQRKVKAQVKADNNFKQKIYYTRSGKLFVKSIQI